MKSFHHNNYMTSIINHFLERIFLKNGFFMVINFIKVGNTNFIEEAWRENYEKTIYNLSYRYLFHT